MEYVVVTAANCRELSEKVNKWLERGYVPQGGAFSFVECEHKVKYDGSVFPVSKTVERYGVGQAMIKN